MFLFLGPFRYFTKMTQAPGIIPAVVAELRTLLVERKEELGLSPATVGAETTCWAGQSSRRLGRRKPDQDPHDRH